MATNWQAGATGAITGAGLGAAKGGAVLGVPGIVAGGLIGGALGLMSKKRKPPKPQQIDIGSELAMISEMYNQARAQQQELGARQLAQGLTQTSESLAGRGIYRSPVSQRALGETRKTYAMALSDALAKLSAEEVAKRAELSAAAKQYNLGQQNQYNQLRYAQSQANQAALTGGLTSLGAALLMRGARPTATVPTTAETYNYVQDNPFEQQNIMAQQLLGTNPNLRLAGGGF